MTTDQVKLLNRPIGILITVYNYDILLNTMNINKNYNKMVSIIIL
jgi:hypothetical protein